MENTSFYFFSTIPQVLAAIVALIGAFHIFRNQLTKNTLISYAESVYNKANEIHNDDLIHIVNEMKTELSAKKFEQVESLIRQIIEFVENQQNLVVVAANLREKVDRYFEVKKVYIKRQNQFRNTFITSIVIIIISLFALTLTTQLINYVAIILYAFIISACVFNFWQVYKYVKITE